MKYPLIYLIFLSIFCKIAQADDTIYKIEKLKQDKPTTERLLINMLDINRFDLIKQLLPVYQSIENSNQKLISLANIRLAQNLFFNYQNKNAKNILKAIQNSPNLSKEEQYIIKQYLYELNERDSWQFSFSANYLRNKNVNNASSEHQIEDTGFTKNNDMLPQSATGLAYYFSAERNWNVVDSHYLHFSNELLGKYYWDNKDFDESNNRTYIGYIYQNAKLKFASKAFYERQWFARHRYNWANGFRTELEYSLAPKWKISTAMELSQPHYFKQREKNGTIKLISSTLIWQPNHLSYLYWGIDFIREKTQVKQYSNDTKGLRLGGSRIWTGNFITQINSSISWRNYKDKASLGGILPLDKIRKDKIYNANLTVWKSDWNWSGFTPKIQLKYKKQKSNIPSVFSYAEKNVQLIIEKTF